MLLTLHAALLLGAFICFVCATFGVSAKVNWIGAGLALFMLAALFTSGVIAAR